MSDATVTLPSDTEILIEREFAAPQDLVFRAWTTPELIERWWHAGRGTITSVEMDARPGGSWRYAMVTPDGTEVAFHGEVREVVPGQRLVTTEVYEGAPEAEALTTLELTDAGEGRTKATLRVTYGRREYRDGHLEAGMEDGLQDALRLLEQVAVSLK